MKKNRSLLFLVILFAAFAGCKKDNNEKITPTGLIYTYFPVNVGHTVIYDVSLITKDEFSGIEDTALYQIMEVVDSIFTDIQGRPTERLERYKRATTLDPWIINDVWTSNLTSTRVEKKEENVTFVKMVFPITGTVSWNGNLYNTLDPQIYEYDQLNQPDLVNGQNFDSTLVVIQANDDNFIETKYEIEEYATGVGMIYKEQTFIKKDNSQPPIVGVISQRIYKQTIVSWNN